MISDTWYSALSRTLPEGVENLTLMGTATINGTGNSGNNVLTGNSANNTLNGGGGNDTLNGSTGVDTLIGGLGDDIFQIDSTTDVITENANEGTDTIQSSLTFSLATFPNIENLTLTGSSAINGTGNTANNVLTGNAANNILSGDTGNDILTGAAGKDTLTGGTGIDKFGYKTLTDSLLANYDLITDFNATTGNDLFLVTTARAGFTTGLTVATLDAAGIGAKLTTTNFAANYAAQFTFTSGTTTRTFVAINDAIAGFNASTDSIVEVTGLTGTLVIGNFVTA
jgi:Ca2+-binding RTX toxin-like protein